MFAFELIGIIFKVGWLHIVSCYWKILFRIILGVLLLKIQQVLMSSRALLKKITIVIMTNKNTTLLVMDNVSFCILFIARFEQILKGLYLK